MRAFAMPRLLAMLLTITLLCQYFPAGTAFAIENEKVSVSFSSVVENGSEVITINAEPTAENIEITGITLPDGKYVEASVSQYTAVANDTYDFDVTYRETVMINTPTLPEVPLEDEVPVIPETPVVQETTNIDESPVADSAKDQILPVTLDNQVKAVDSTTADTTTDTAVDIVTDTVTNKVTDITEDVKTFSFKATKVVAQVYYIDTINGSDTNNGLSIATPMKTIDFEKISGQNIEIHLISTNKIVKNIGTLSIPNDKAYQNVTIKNETENSSFKISTVYANGVPTTLIDTNVSNFIGASHNEPWDGNTSISLIGDKYHPTFVKIIGGGETTDKTKSADVTGNTNIYIENANGANSMFVCGGGVMSSVAGNTNIKMINSNAKAVMGGGFIDTYSESKNSVPVNVGGSATVVIDGGEFQYICGNTYLENRSPQYEVRASAAVSNGVNIQIENATVKYYVMGNTYQRGSGNTGSKPVNRPYSEVSVDNGVNIDIKGSTIGSKPGNISTWYNSNAPGVIGGSFLENGTSYTGGFIHIALDNSFSEMVKAADMVILGDSSEKTKTKYVGGQATIEGNISVAITNGSTVNFINALSDVDNSESNMHKLPGDVWAKINGNIDITCENSTVYQTLGNVMERNSCMVDENIVIGDITYNYTNVQKLQTFIAGFTETGTLMGDMAINFNNCYGDSSKTGTIGGVRTYGGLTSGQIKQEGVIEYILKEAKIDTLYTGSRVNNTNIEGNTSIQLEDSNIKIMTLGNWNNSALIKSVIKGNINLVADGTKNNITTLYADASENVTTTGDITVDINHGTIGTLYGTGNTVSSRVPVLVGNTSITIGKDASISESITAASDPNATVSGKKVLTVLAPQNVKIFDNTVHPFTTINLGGTLLTNSLICDTTFPSELNLLGTWQDGNTILAGKTTATASGAAASALEWFTQTWTAPPKMLHELSGATTGTLPEYEGRWYLHGDKISKAAVTYTTGVTDDSVSGMPNPSSFEYTIGTDHTVVSQEPTRSGFTFEGWIKDYDITSIFHTGQSITVTQDITLTASWKPVPSRYTVTFDSKEGTPVMSETINDGDLVTKPMDPTRNGYTFGGWYTEETYVNEYDFNLPVTADFTLFAKWSSNSSGGGDGGGDGGGSVVPSSYEVKFVDWDGQQIGIVQTVEHGKDAVEPASTEIPIRIGYTFIGWNNAFTNVTANLTVTAQYSEDAPAPIAKHRVTFKDWNGTVLKTDRVEHGKDAIAPATPKRLGYTFTGWDKTFTNVTTDLIIIAQYSQNDTGGGSGDGGSGNGGGGSNTGGNTVDRVERPDPLPPDPLPVVELPVNPPVITKSPALAPKAAVPVRPNTVSPFVPNADNDEESSLLLEDENGKNQKGTNRPGFGFTANGNLCILHWIILLAAALLAVYGIIRRKDDNGDEDELEQEEK